MLQTDIDVLWLCLLLSVLSINNLYQSNSAKTVCLFLFHVNIFYLNWSFSKFYFTRPPLWGGFLLGKASENALVVINGIRRSSVWMILVLAHYWWAVQLRLSFPPVPPSSSPSSISKLVRPDALPAHTQMQIMQRQSFISNQTREAAEHPGSSVPTELVYLRGSD